MMDIKVEKDGKFIMFKNDGTEFYDIEPQRCNGFPTIMDCLETKTWFTPEVKSQVEALLDV